MKTGQVIGATDRSAAKPPNARFSSAMSLPPSISVSGSHQQGDRDRPDGRPQHLVDAGCEPLREVI